MELTQEQLDALARMANERIAQEAAAAADAAREQAIADARAALDARQQKLRDDAAALLAPAQASLEKLRSTCALIDADDNADPESKRIAKDDACAAHEAACEAIHSTPEYLQLIQEGDAEVEVLAEALRQAENS